MALRPVDRRGAHDLVDALGPTWSSTWPFDGRAAAGEDPEAILWAHCRLQYLVTRTADDGVIGVVQGLDEDLRSGTISVAAAVSPAARRRGWATEALALFVNLLISGHGYRKLRFEVPAGIVDDVIGSGHGWLRREGALTRHVLTSRGRDDLVFFALFADEWNRDEVLDWLIPGRSG